MLALPAPNMACIKTTRNLCTVEMLHAWYGKHVNLLSTLSLFMRCFVTNLLEYRDAFALFDKRGDGKIDSDQIGDVLRALNLNPTEADVKKIVNEVDPNGECSKPQVYV